MDSSRKKVQFRLRQTAVTPPVHLKRRVAVSVTHSRQKTWPNEDLNTLPLGDSPGPTALGALSLDTPKRKAEELCEIIPSSGKLKLRKLSRLNAKSFMTSKEKSMDCSSKLLEFSESWQTSPSPTHTIVLKRKQRTPEEGSKAIYRMAVLAAIDSTRANNSTPNDPKTFRSSTGKTEEAVPASLDKWIVNINCSLTKPKDEDRENNAEQEDRWSCMSGFEDSDTPGEHSEPKAGGRSVVLKGNDSPGRYVEPTSPEDLYAAGNTPEAEPHASSLPDLDDVPEFYFTTSANGCRQMQSSPVNTQGATRSSTFTNETSEAIQVSAWDMDALLSPPQRNVFLSVKQFPLPNLAGTENENFLSSQNMGLYPSFPDPFALPLHSYGGASNSTTPRRWSDVGSSMRYPPMEVCHGSTPKRLSMGALPIWSSYPHLDSEVGFIDTHCHLDMLYGKLGFQGTFGTFRERYRSSFPAEFRGCVTNFCNPELMAKEALWEDLLAEDGVWGAFGCHPHFAKSYSSIHEHNILMAMRHPKAVAFGEMGLDYSHKNTIVASRQKQVFERQLRLAVAMQKPLVIHCRDADDDMLAILKKCVPRDYKIHRHCFTSSYPVIEPFLTEFPNLYVGFTALITYLTAKRARRALRLIPLNRIVLETDAPYFLPRQVNRKVCRFSHPGMGIHTLRELSLLKGEDMNTVLATIRSNTSHLYGI